MEEDALLKKCIKIELKKSLHNKATAVTLIFVIILSLLHAIKAIKLNNYQNSLPIVSGNPMISGSSIFANRLGADVASFESNIFFFLLPIIVVLPYGWSLVGEIHSGYTKNILCRISRKSYFVSKYIAVFVSSAVVVAIPLLLNFAVLSLFLPALKLEKVYPYGVVGQPSMWSSIHYENPFLYAFLYIMLNVVFAGLIASISTAIAFFLKYKVPVMIMPFFTILVIEYLDMNIATNSDISPIRFLRALPIANDHFGGVIFLIAAILFVSTIGTVLYKEGKYEVL